MVPEPTADTRSATEAFIALCHVLRDDIDYDQAAVLDDDGKPRDVEPLSEEAARNRRRYVRTCFAHVDGTMHGLKELLVNIAPQLGAPLTTDDEDFLREQGIPKYKYPRIRDNVECTLKLAARVISVPLANMGVTFGDTGWQRFGDANEFRTQVTHPKTAAGLTLSNSDLARTWDAMLWYRGALGAVVAELRERVRLPGTTDLDV